MNKFTAPGKMKQVNATILAPENAGLRIILNLCSENGKFESTLDKLLYSRWARVKSDFKEWHATQHNFKLGLLNTNSAVASDTWICEALVKDKNDKLDEKSLEVAVKKIKDLCKYEKASLHVSNILTNDFPSLVDLLKNHLVDEGINVYFYEEPKK